MLQVMVMQNQKYWFGDQESLSFLLVSDFESPMCWRPYLIEIFWKVENGERLLKAKIAYPRSNEKVRETALA